MPSTRIHSYSARLASSYINSPSATQINDEDQIVTSTRASKQSPELSPYICQSTAKLLLQKLPKYSLYSGKKLFLQHSRGFPANKWYLIRVSSPVKMKIFNPVNRTADETSIRECGLLSFSSDL